MIDKILHVIERDDLSTKDRRREKLHKRAFLCAILRKQEYPLSFIGKLFNRNHATILHAYKSINQKTEADAQFKMVVNQLRKQLQTS